MLHLFVFIVLTWEKEAYIKVEYDNRKINIEDLCTLSTNKMMIFLFEYNEFAADEIYEIYYKDLIENKRYVELYCQTNLLILHIFKIRTKNISDSNNVIKELHDQITFEFKKMRPSTISNFLIKKIQIYNNLIQKPDMNSINYKVKLHKELFYLFILEFRKQIKLTRRKYCILLMLLNYIENGAYIDANGKIGYSSMHYSNMACKNFSNRGIVTEKVLLILDFKLFDTFYSSINSFFNI